jgi:Ca2+-binding RTX toxin-like protein
MRVRLVSVCVTAAALTIATAALADVQPISLWSLPYDNNVCDDIEIDGVALQGDEANDIIVGTERSDLLRGGGGGDELSGEDAPNCLYGQDGRDKVRGGASDDQLWGNTGGDRIAGGAGNDVIRTGPGRDRVKGGPGHDGIVVQGGGVDAISCGPGFDRAIVDRKDRVSSSCERLFLSSRNRVHT